MTVTKTLIENACYLSLYDEAWQPDIETGIVTSALNQFNLMLDEFRDKIPYTFTYTFDDVNELTNTSFVSIDSLNYVINTILFPMTAVNLVKWREIAIVEGLIGIPEIYWFDESTQTVHVYPLPANPSYEFIVSGRRALGPLALFDTLPVNMTLFMQNALTYELAFRITGKFNGVWNDLKEATRQQLMKGLREKQVIDLTPTRNVLFSNCDPNVPPFPSFFYLSGGTG